MRVEAHARHKERTVPDDPADLAGPDWLYRLKEAPSLPARRPDCHAQNVSSSGAVAQNGTSGVPLTRRSRRPWRGHPVAPFARAAGSGSAEGQTRCGSSSSSARRSVAESVTEPKRISRTSSEAS
jgi:hypothetical protein